MEVEISEDDAKRLLTVLNIFHTGMYSGMIRVKSDSSKAKYSDAIKRIAENTKKAKEIKVAVIEEKPKGEWKLESSSGYQGYRCTACKTWVYRNNPKACECDEVVKNEN